MSSRHPNTKPKSSFIAPRQRQLPQLKSANISFREVGDALAEVARNSHVQRASRARESLICFFCLTRSLIRLSVAPAHSQHDDDSEVEDLDDQDGRYDPVLSASDGETDDDDDEFDDAGESANDVLVSVRAGKCCGTRSLSRCLNNFLPRLSLCLSQPSVPWRSPTMTIKMTWTEVRRAHLCFVRALSFLTLSSGLRSFLLLCLLHLDLGSVEPDEHFIGVS